MGARGRNARPQAKIKTLPGKLDTPPPEDISPAAKKIWQQIVDDCPPGHIQPKNYELFRGYCEENAVRNWSYALLWKQGPMITTESGIVKKNPLIDIISAANTKIATLCTKLGLSIQGQAGNIPPKPISKEENAYNVLKARKSKLKGDELSLFKKLEKEYGVK